MTIIRCKILRIGNRKGLPLREILINELLKTLITNIIIKHFECYSPQKSN